MFVHLPVFGHQLDQTADLEWMSKKYKKKDYSTIRGLPVCVCVHNRV